MFLNKDITNLQIPKRKSDIELTVEAFMNGSLGLMKDDHFNVTFGIKPVNDNECAVFFEHSSMCNVDYHYFAIYEMDWPTIKKRLEDAPSKAVEATLIIREEVSKLLAKLKSCKDELIRYIDRYATQGMILYYDCNWEKAYRDMVSQVKYLLKFDMTKPIEVVPVQSNHIAKANLEPSEEEEWKPSSTMTWVSLSSAGW